MTTSSIRRQMKNIVNNYSEAEIKVREATSNDPWGPSSSLMTEIADLTYNVVAFSEIMSMIWKRLNDHGKNWRHVYKALTLLDYLIKTGSERVAQQCKENIFAIQTLKDFQYIDRDGKDQGINVREKSKQLVSLLKDDERLKTERAQALKTKERMAQVATGVGSNQITFGRGSSQPNLSTSYSEQEYGKSGGSPASYHGCAKPAASVDPWAAPAGSTAQSKNVDPWAPAQPSSTAAKSSVDPWGPAPANKPLSTSAESGSTLPSQHSGTTSPDLFDSQHSSVTSGKQSAARKTPESFLGPNAALVNLDSLVSKPPQPVTSLNPFLAPEEGFGLLKVTELKLIDCQKRCRYSTDSNQPLPSESASAPHSQSDESEPCDGNQPFFQCCATDEHGANTSAFHGPRARGNGTDTSYGHCGLDNQDGPGAEREHCRINDPTSSQYRNPAVSVPAYKYN
ncbi:epsin-2 isoform x2 [Limosa lapponica baueri]|uniref:Epsin-2 isoform x2 n=1 Tax=Limosa lapponica baueri TaxID=1758121 RepID=A0A2I0TGW7_LIMLA|nr:epsin-2 isoform x2 [Limosa lapponica baueri]